MKRTISIVLSIVMMLALAVVPAFAEDTTAAETTAATTPANGSITITLPTTQTSPTGTVTYKIYKVFDATYSTSGISYKLVSGKTSAPTGFTVDTAGNVTHPGTATELTDAEIAAIASYVTENDLVKTVTVDMSATPTPTTATADNLAFGYYYITTSNGTVVTIDSTNPDATVNDKNFIPKVVKSAGTEYSESAKKAIAQAGTDQPFTSEITVGKGTTKLVFTDTMTNLTYNNDVKVYVGGTEVSASTSTFGVSAITGGFKIEFVDTYVEGLITGTATSAVIVIKYSGKVASDALSVNPAENTATITSGNGTNTSSDTVEVYNAKFTVTKKDGSQQPLVGAGFIVARPSTATGAAAGAMEYYQNTSGTVNWVASEDNATVYTSDANGAVPAFTGLGAGTYTLIEKVVPNGYNKAADSTFTISASDYTSANLEQTATVTNNAGVELPATGGIGTKLFIAFGSVLAVAAGVVIVTNKRAKKEEI